MFAVLATGGKQYKVSQGDVIEVEKLDHPVGEKVEVGSPYLEGCSVTLEVTEQLKGPKLIIFKMKRRKNYRRKTGHRQQYTRLKVTGINAK